MLPTILPGRSLGCSHSVLCGGALWLDSAGRSDGRPVVDSTGLKEAYSFELRFRPESEPSVSAADSGEADDLPSIFQALRDQLGLELTPEKGPVSKLVIDHIEKPSAN